MKIHVVSEFLWEEFLVFTLLGRVDSMKWLRVLGRSAADSVLV